MMNYSEMKQAMARRVADAGWPLGTAVVVNGRAGAVADVNPFFHDMADPSIYVDLQPKKAGRRTERRLVRLSQLKGVTQ